MFVCSCVVCIISNDVNCNNSWPRENMINKSHILATLVGLQVVWTIYNIVCYVYPDNDQRSYIISLLVWNGITSYWGMHKRNVITILESCFRRANTATATTEQGARHWCVFGWCRQINRDIHCIWWNFVVDCNNVCHNNLWGYIIILPKSIITLILKKHKIYKLATLPHVFIHFTDYISHYSLLQLTVHPIFHFRVRCITLEVCLFFEGSVSFVFLPRLLWWGGCFAHDHVSEQWIVSVVSDK